MLDILINQIWSHNNKHYRILYIDQEIDLLIWIETRYNDNCFPEELELSEFRALLKRSEVVHLNYTDDYVPIDNLTPKTKIKLENDWALITDFINEEPIVFDRKHFNKKCRELGELHNCSRQTVRRLAIKYWVNGKTKLSLISNYHNSGGKGKQKQLTLINGRQRTDNRKSIILDNATKLKIKKGYKRWYLKVKQASKRTAYNNFIRKNFPKEWKSKNLSKVPSLKQFIYWGELDLSSEARLKAKHGDINFDKDFRINEGSSYSSVNGPGISQIDSTPSDVELISEIDESPIGCPTVYFVCDVYSAMVLGVHVTLESPSYVQAMEALYCSFSNKDEFFKKSLLDSIESFELSSEDWPCEYIPNSIVTDRGPEFISRNSNNLVQSLGIQIENKESYRPELKGLVEKLIDLVHTELRGSEENIGIKDKDDGRRGATKARAYGTFTMREYLAILVMAIVRHNNSRLLKNYPLDHEMPKDGLYVPTPSEVFNWGILNKSGKLRSNKIRNLRTLMLPRENVNLTKNGIKFNNVWYKLPKDHPLRDVQLKTQRKTTKLDASYEPYNLNQLFIINEKEIIPCDLNLEKSGLFKNKTIWDIKSFITTQKSKISEAKYSETLAAIHFLESSENIRKKKAKKISSSPQSKTVKKNREQDKELERQRRMDAANPDNDKKETKVIKMTSTNLDQPDFLDFIDQLMGDE